MAKSCPPCPPNAMLTTERRPGQPAQGSIYFLHSPPHSEGSRNIAFRGQGGRKMPQGFDLFFHLRSGRSCARGTPQMVSTTQMSTSHGPGPWPGTMAPGHDPGPWPRAMAPGQGPGAWPRDTAPGHGPWAGARVPCPLVEQFPPKPLKALREALRTPIFFVRRL